LIGANGEHRSPLRSAHDLEVRRRQERDTLGAKALDRFAARHCGAKFNQFLIGRADDLDLRRQRLIQRRIHTDFAQTERAGP
jgi:hypothetical protein